MIFIFFYLGEKKTRFMLLPLLGLMSIMDNQTDLFILYFSNTRSFKMSLQAKVENNIVRTIYYQIILIIGKLFHKLVL